MIEIFGYIAGALVTVVLLPQVIKAIKSKSTEGISLYMYIVYVLGIAIWDVYGILLKDLPLILANSIAIVLALAVLIIKAVNVKRGEKP